ncbi:hypothetical protein GCM10007415_19200 [Parapedobacter pyrenivorans]|uniref:Outer membrane protein beta-barrel domain-containing protein n=1 Tax=Parapedobacter pyrenivorans TaxID=1305674 RepID=A0A917HQ91_9SPHI|nr:hypothetical protein [Parapedobacter pyrenivorans]GGG85923.1 hypothetical protein GCM10007415_19200 [Parapedobacter pyrenivorans]
MNEREENKELIRRIAETLRDHVEPYKEGAWERFDGAHTKPARRVLWLPYWSAAAVLLLAVGLFWFTRQSENPEHAQPDLARQGVGSQQVIPQEPATSVSIQEEQPIDATVGTALPVSIAENEQLLAVGHTVVNRDAVAATDTVAEDAIRLDEAIGLADTTAVTEENPISQRLAATVERDTPGQSVNPFSAEGLVDQETSSPAYAIAANKSRGSLGKWDLGLVVSPSLTSEQVNMGGGIAVAYRLSDKFSLGSGVSIGQLGVGQNPNYEPGMEYSATPNAPNPSTGSAGFVADAKAYREETSVTSSVVALDIPFDLRYEVAKGFYTSVGVSYVAVLNEQRTSHYVARLNERTLENNYAADKNLAAAVAAVFSEEKIADQPMKGKGYTGFVNFSIGRKIPLSSKLSLAVEPYFKLPIGRLSRADMDFTNGGIRIVTGF